MFRVCGNPWAVESPPDQERCITWDRGRVRGDPALVEWVRSEARRLDGQRVGPEEGPYTRRGHLSSPLSACIIMAEAFLTNTVRITGDVPRRPPIPSGAIG